MKAPSRDWLRVGEVAAQLQVSDRSVRRWMRAGELCHQILSRRNVRIPKRALDAFLASRVQGSLSPDPKSSLFPGSRSSTPTSPSPTAPSSESAWTPSAGNEHEKGLLSTPGLVPTAYSLARDGALGAKEGRS